MVVRFKTYWEQMPDGIYLNIGDIPLQIKEKIRKLKEDEIQECILHKTILFKYPIGDSVYMSKTLDGYVEFWFE